MTNPCNECGAEVGKGNFCSDECRDQNDMNKVAAYWPEKVPDISRVAKLTKLPKARVQAAAYRIRIKDRS